MDISQNSLSNEALWIFYDRLLQQARQLERSLATPSNRGNPNAPTDVPQGINPVTPIRQTDGHDSGDPQDEDISSNAEGKNDRENDQLSSSLSPDQRQVTITLSNSPVRTRPPPTTPDQHQVTITLSSSSNHTQTPAELRVPVQPVQQFPPDLRNVPALETTRSEVLEPTKSRQARRRIIIKREIVDQYRTLVDTYMGVRYNIYTEDTPSPDSSDSSIPEPEPIQSDVLSLITLNAYVEVSIVESTAYDISNLGLAREGNYYIGRFDFEGATQRNRARFRERTWADLVSKAGALGTDFNTAYSKVCDYLRGRRKLIMFVNIGSHATVLTLARESKTATFFDTWTSRNNEERALLLCSSVIRSVFNETTEGWTLQYARVTKQNIRANNCGIHSLLRIRDELENNSQHDTNETSANTMRLYLALRGAHGEAQYPLADIIN